jgi:predicted short-subunit dehydrogenase-like oxidoreductase (DUF2520 family)
LPRLRISIVGTGNVSSALARALHAAGYKLVEVLARKQTASLRRAQVLAVKVGAKAGVIGGQSMTADVFLLCVSDDAIADVSRQLAASPGWRDKVALHTSGALASGELAALRKKGARVGSMHPMNSFVSAAYMDLRGTPMAIEGDAVAIRVANSLAKSVGCPTFEIDAGGKVLYHAMGAFFSPLLISLLEAGERVGKAGGVKAPKKVMTRILLQTVMNYVKHGAPGAFSGPLKRGDVQTVGRHLRALKKVKGAEEIYRALARNAVERLPVGEKKRLKRLF